MKIFKKFLSVTMASFCLILTCATPSHALFSGRYASREEVLQFIESGNIAAIDNLLQLGEDIEMLDSGGEWGGTALHHDAKHNQTDVDNILALKKRKY